MDIEVRDTDIPILRSMIIGIIGCIEDDITESMLRRVLAELERAMQNDQQTEICEFLDTGEPK